MADQRRQNEDLEDLAWPRPRSQQIWRRKRDGMLVRILHRRNGWVFAYDCEHAQTRGRGMTEQAFIEHHDFLRNR